MVSELQLMLFPYIFSTGYWVGGTNSSGTTITDMGITYCDGSSLAFEKLPGVMPFGINFFDGGIMHAYPAEVHWKLARNQFIFVRWDRGCFAVQTNDLLKDETSR